MNTYNVIIIGAGPAGIAASVYASRKHMKTLTLTKDIGGQAAISLNVKNYPGYQFISADELIKKFEEHQKNYGLEVKLGVQVDSIKKISQGFRVSLGDDFYNADSVIIATGTEPKKLGIPGESEFLGRGVTYCATCDAPFFKDKVVSVVGDGPPALYAVIQLLSIAKKIFLITNSSTFSGDPKLIKKMKNAEKVSVMTHTHVEEIIGDMVVKKITIKNEAGKVERLAVDGLFIEIGSEPLIPTVNGDIKKLKTNVKHEIVVDEQCATSIPGIFAAGDVTNVPEKQVIIASGQGCIAGLSAFRYINK
jgi:alkyl hydroperoxide reductase subunit F